MDSIDTLLANRAEKPTGIVSGEVPVWNGTTWVRSSVTKIGPGSIGTGTPSAATFLQGDGTWAGAFSAYVPAWTSGGTAPVLNNGTLTGRFLQIGKLVLARIVLTIGSTTTLGSGAWLFSLPVNTAQEGSIPTGHWRVNDVSPVADYHGFVQLNSISTILPMTTASPAAAITPTVPIAWATGDALGINIMYEAV